MILLVGFRSMQVRKSRGALIVVTASLLIGLLPFLGPVNASVKAGQTCKKIGQKLTVGNQELQCKKKGSKLYWTLVIKKNVRLPQSASPTISPTPLPVSSPSASPSPSPSKVLTIAERWDALDSSALDAARKLMLAPRASSHSVNFTWRGSENSNTEVLAEVKRRYESAAKFWEPYFVVKNPLLVVVGGIGELEWICKEKLAWLAPWNQPDCVEVEGKGDWSNGTAGQSQTRTRNIDMYTLDTVNRLNDVGYLARIEHEYTHNIIHLLNADYNTTMPCWMIESGAEYWGVLSASGENFTRFVQLRNYQSQRQSSAIKGASESGWYDFLIRTDRTDLIRQPNTDACGPVRGEIYSHAFLANEFLVGKVGLDGYFDLVKLSGTLGWSKAVEAKFGKSREELYREMARYMKTQFELIVDNPWSLEGLSRRR